ncbi:MAG: DUF3291 domain-containing protein [Granulosicoccus sp.]
MAWELAQLNIATLVAPLDSPVLADFVANLDRINGIADQSPGFVWRLQTNEGDATDLEHDFDNNVIVNLSVWESVEDLHNYVYKTAHAQVMSRRKEWFERMSDAYTVLWWVPKGHQPTTSEAKQKLDVLKSDGPGSAAFTFKNVFEKPSD